MVKNIFGTKWYVESASKNFTTYNHLKREPIDIYKGAFIGNRRLSGAKWIVEIEGSKPKSFKTRESAKRFAKKFMIKHK